MKIAHTPTHTTTFMNTTSANTYIACMPDIDVSYLTKVEVCCTNFSNNPHTSI